MRRRKRVKPCEGQLSLFVEKHFDWKEVLDLHGVSYDFSGTCVRPDGTAYGHPGEKCHRGVEGSPKAYEEAAKSGSLSSASQDTAFELAVAALESAGGTRPNVDPKIVGEIAIKRAEFEEKLAKGEVPEQLIIDSFKKEHLGYREAEFIFLGMEPGLGGAWYRGEGLPAGGKHVADHLATMAAAQKYDPSDVKVAANLAGSREMIVSKDVAPSSFLNIGSQMVARAKAQDPNVEVSSDQVKVDWATTKITSINMNGAAAFKTNYGNPGQVKVSGDVKKGTAKYEDQMDPNRSSYGFLAGPGGKYPNLTRSNVMKLTEKERAGHIADTLIDAAQNGNMKGGFGAPGDKGKYKIYENSVLRAFHDKGYKVYETEVTLKTGAGQVDQKTGKSKEKSAKHTVHAVDLGDGKVFVSSDFSLNRPGYGAKVNNNPYKAYQTGRKMVEVEKRKPGSMKQWTPGASSSAKPKPASTKTNTTSKPRAKAAPKKEEPKRTPPRKKTAMELALEEQMKQARADGRDNDAKALRATLRSLQS